MSSFTTDPADPLRAAADAYVSDLIRKFRPGWSIPQPFYNDERVFARDVERIFFREWLLIDHASRIPRPGDYFLFEIAGESLIIIRGKDGQVHALFNVCRHRGSRVCLESSGSASALVCPYHAWSYGLDGRLLAARAMADDLDRSSLGLRRGSVRLVDDLIFVALTDQPPDWEPAFALWEKFLRPHGLKHARIAHRMSWRLKANWKILIENFMECYHCGPAHPEYSSVMLQAKPSSGLARDAEKYEELVQRWTEVARRQGTYLERTTLEGKPHCMCARLPIRDGFLTQSQTGRPVAPLMGEFKEYDGGVTGGEMGQGNYFIAPNDYVLIPRFTPLTAATSEMELIWLVRADAKEGVDYNREELLWLWKVTTEQDKRIIEDNQAGVDSRTYEPGPLAPVERGLARFAADYLRAIS